MIKKVTITLKYQSHHVQDIAFTQKMYTVELMRKSQLHLQSWWETKRKQCEGLWES